MATNKLTPYEISIKERLGNWLTFWYDAAPKCNGLCVMRATLEKFAAWNRFITNFHKCNKREGFAEVFEYIIRTEDVHNLLEWAFVWAETPEGAEYWSELDGAIKERFSKTIKQGIDLKAKSTSKNKADRINPMAQPVIPRHHRGESFPARKPQRQLSGITPNELALFSLLGAANKIENVEQLIYLMSQAEKEKEMVVDFDIPLTSTTIVSVTKVS